ncbi:tachykinin receptor isoform X1 [Ciona intestinalis]
MLLSLSLTFTLLFCYWTGTMYYIEGSVTYKYYKETLDLVGLRPNPAIVPQPRDARIYREARDVGQDTGNLSESYVGVSSNFSGKSQQLNLLPVAFNVTMNISSTRDPSERMLTDVTATTEDHHEDEENPFAQSPYAIFGWSVVYGLLVVVALVGNLGICWIVIRNKRMQTVTNFFLASTAFADSNVIGFNTVFNFTYALNNDWYFGKAFCHFINFVPIGAVLASILSITVISLDRFGVIMYPLRRRTSRKTAKMTIAGIWLFSLGVAFPQCFFATITTEESGTRTTCSIQWPDGVSGRMRLGYQLSFMVISYFLPLIILAVSYVAMALRLCGSNNQVGHQNETQLRRIANNKKAIRMMMLVVVVFAICWCPYHLFFLADYIVSDSYHWEKIQQVYLAVFWVAMSSSMYNPFIYCWNNSRFREEFKRLCCCFKLVHQPKLNMGLRNRSVNYSTVAAPEITVHLHFDSDREAEAHERPSTAQTLL